MSKRSHKSDNSKRQQPVQQQRAQARVVNPNKNLEKAEKELRETPSGSTKDR